MRETARFRVRAWHVQAMWATLHPARSHDHYRPPQLTLPPIFGGPTISPVSHTVTVSFPSVPSRRPRMKNWLLLAHGPSAHTTGPRLLGLGVQSTRSLAATLPPGYHDASSPSIRETELPLNAKSPQLQLASSQFTDALASHPVRSNPPACRLTIADVLELWKF